MNKKKYYIGYTAGVFDLFHIGHLNIIRKAKEQCEHLIVAVSTDELVQQYKKISPTIPFEERVEIVKACRYVDKVVPQVNRDKYAAYKKHKFDVMFVGDDWKGNALFVELEKKLSKNGAEIVFFPYTETTSSTIIRNVLSDIVTNK